MSTAEILNELPNLTSAERREIAARLAELEGEAIDLRRRGIDAVAAADLRDRLTTFAEDWNGPEMDAYDNYDAARAKE